jgi:DNA (cytosine-5)-methyltransferase 1
MVEYSCAKCGKKYTRKTYYDKHLNKKNPCVEDEIKQPKKLNVIDLFCGVGGMSKGLYDAELNIIAGVDIWDKAIENYEKNFNHTAICADLTQLSPAKFNELYNTKNEYVDLICGGPPCFLSETKVLTLDGYKNIEDIQPKDKLLTHTGKFQNIVNTQKKIYSGDLYKFDIECHTETIISTEEHPFLVCEKKRIWNDIIKDYTYLFENPCWKKANEITINDYFGMVINNNDYIPEFTFNNMIKMDKPEYWFIMGYYVANGFTKMPKYNIEFIVDTDDETKIFEKINCVILVTCKKHKKIVCSNYFWYNILKQFGECVENKIIPEWVQDAPKHLIQEFMNGYNKHVSATTSNNITLSLQRLNLKLKQKTRNNYAWFAPIKIAKEKTFETPVYNFEIENDNSYIVENVVVHNCQGFSIAGKRDKNDPRNSLFMEFVKYLEYFAPKTFIMENVMGILSMKTSNDESAIDIILSELGKNYHCITCKLYASDFEVPQNRRRVIIIGTRKDLNIIPTEPTQILTKENRISVKTIIQPRDQIEQKYYLSEKAINGIINKKKKSEEKKCGFGAQFLDMDKPSYTIPARIHKDGYDALVKYSNSEIRRLTILELKRIQTFPDNFIMEGTKKDIIIQIGNAVSCRFAYHLGKHIINILQQ